MSGGYYNYLYSQWAGDIAASDSARNDLRAISQRLAGLGHESAAHDSRVTLAILEQATSAFTYLQEGLADVWKAAEWLDSNDWDVEPLNKSAERWNTLRSRKIAIAYASMAMHLALLAGRDPEMKCDFVFTAEIDLAQKVLARTFGESAAKRAIDRAIASGELGCDAIEQFLGDEAAACKPLTGLSLSFCVRDIAEGLVPIELVDCIYCGFDWSGSAPEEYFAWYWKAWPRSKIESILSKIDVRRWPTATRNIARGCWMGGPVTEKRLSDTEDRIRAPLDAGTLLTLTALGFGQAVAQITDSTKRDHGLQRE